MVTYSLEATPKKMITLQVFKRRKVFERQVSFFSRYISNYLNPCSQTLYSTATAEVNFGSVFFKLKSRFFSGFFPFLGWEATKTIRILHNSLYRKAFFQEATSLLCGFRVDLKGPIIYYNKVRYLSIH